MRYFSLLLENLSKLIFCFVFYIFSSLFISFVLKHRLYFKIKAIVFVQVVSIFLYITSVLLSLFFQFGLASLYFNNYWFSNLGYQVVIFVISVLYSFCCRFICLVKLYYFGYSIYFYILYLYFRLIICYSGVILYLFIIINFII